MKTIFQHHDDEFNYISKCFSTFFLMIPAFLEIHTEAFLGGGLLDCVPIKDYWTTLLLYLTPFVIEISPVANITYLQQQVSEVVVVCLIQLAHYLRLYFRMHDEWVVVDLDQIS